MNTMRLRQTFTTAEAALFIGVDPRSLARLARRLGVEPVRRVRVGRSTITAWDRAGLTVLGKAVYEARQHAA
jgi:hypothetical protein